MGQAQFDAVVFNQDDLDAALGDFAIATLLPIEVQRSLASRVLIASSLAAVISSEAEYALALAGLGELPVEPEEIAFFSNFSRGLVRDIEEEFGDMGDLGEQGTQITMMTKRIGAMAQHS